MFGTVNVDISSQLNIIEYDLANGSVPSGGACPSFVFQTNITSTDADGLIKGRLESLSFGFKVGTDSGGLTFDPQVTLTNVTLPGQKTETRTLKDFLDGTLTENLKSAFLTVLNDGLQIAIDKVKGKDLFQDAYKILTLLGVALNVENQAAEEKKYGINSAGWTALLASPESFIEKQLLDLIEVPANRKLLVEVFESITSIQLPTIPALALDMFQSLGLVGSEEDDYPFNFSAFLALVSAPVKTLKERFKELFDNTANIEALVKKFAQNIKPIDFGPFQISSTSTGVVSLAIPKKTPFKIGSGTSDKGIVELSGSLALDFGNQKLTAELDTYVPALGITLSDSLPITYHAGAIQPSFAATLIWGDGTKPSAKPLQIFPLPDNFLDQVADVVPPYVLNLFINAITESQLLKKYPVAQKVFDLLGLVEQKVESTHLGGALGSGDEWSMPSILGIMEHPLDWLLSDNVLGENGRFDIVKLASKLGAIPKASYKKLTIAPNDTKNGVEISGLPYQFYVDVDGANDLATFSFGTKEIDIASGKGGFEGYGLFHQPDRQLPTFFRWFAGVVHHNRQQSFY